MQIAEKDDFYIIKIPKTPKISKSKISVLLAGTGGIKATDLKFNEAPVYITMNLYAKLEDMDQESYDRYRAMAGHTKL